MSSDCVGFGVSSLVGVSSLFGCVCGVGSRLELMFESSFLLLVLDTDFVIVVVDTAPEGSCFFSMVVVITAPSSVCFFSDLVCIVVTAAILFLISDCTISSFPVDVRVSILVSVRCLHGTDIEAEHMLHVSLYG